MRKRDNSALLEIRSIFLLLTAGDIGAAVDDADLGTQLVEEHHGALRLRQRPRYLPHRLNGQTI